MRSARALALCLLAVTVSWTALTPAGSSSAGLRSRRAELATPALIERAVDRGTLDRTAADRYLIAALRGDAVPERFASRTPFDGTLPLVDLHRRGVLHPTPLSSDRCDISTAPLPDSIETPHFYIEYAAAAIGGGLTIDDYVTALEESWLKEIDQFGWAAPPPYPPSPAPGNKYPVRIDPTMGPTLYGFVSNFGTHAGPVGNNPATSWDEGDANASCLVLNSDYDPFPGEPLSALQATAAHEFNHSIQFGWGVIIGRDSPDQIFIEGGATWIEDEVFDESNDNYNYLWPRFDNDMGQYEDSPADSPYPYWITWRGITEPYGTGVPGGGENIMQRFWELTSRNQSSSLEALDAALGVAGTSLPAAYHAYAIAMKVARPCGGGYQPPYCLEEGPAYLAAAGPTPVHGSAAFGAPFASGLPDNYSLHWVTLGHQGTPFQVVLANTSQGGRFRGSLVCDTGTRLIVESFSSVADAGEAAYVRSYDPARCAAPFAVVTNIAQTEANPSSSAIRSYSLSVTPPAGPSTVSLRARAKGPRVVARGRVRPAGAGRIEVTLFRRAGGWDEVRARNERLAPGGSFRASFPMPKATRCRVVATFAGDTTRLSSSRKRSFPC